MSDFARILSRCVVSESSDYGAPYVDSRAWEATFTPDEAVRSKLEVDVTGTTLDLAPFGTVTAVLIRNRDASNFVEVKWRYAKASATFGADEIGFVEGPPDTITDSTSTFITALRAKAGDYAVITGADTSANNDTFLIQAVAAGTLILVEAENLTADDPDPGSPTVAIHCEI